MRRNHPFVAAVAAALVFVGVADTVSAGEPTDQLYLIQEVAVDPGMAGEYEALARQFLTQAEVHEYPYPVYGYSTADYRYFWVVPISGYCEIPTVFAAGETVLEAWEEGPRGRAIKAADGAVRRARHAVYVKRLDLSYLPGTSADEAGGQQYLYWGWCHVKPGHQRAVEKLFSEFVALYVDRGIEWRWTMFEGGVGTDVPMYVYLEEGPSAGSFWTGVDAIHEKIGKEAHELWLELMSHVREYSYTTGMFRKDLSYIPGEAEPEKATHE